MNNLQTESKIIKHSFDVDLENYYYYNIKISLGIYDNLEFSASKVTGRSDPVTCAGKLEILKELDISEIDKYKPRDLRNRILYSNLSMGEYLYCLFRLKNKNIAILKIEEGVFVFLNTKYEYKINLYTILSPIIINNPIKFSEGEEIIKQLKETDPLIVVKNKTGYCFKPIEDTEERLKKNKGEIVFIGKPVGYISEGD